MKTICIDFDGVIYPNFKYHGTATIQGEPVEGVVEALNGLALVFNVVIHSARCETNEGFAAIEKYLNEHGLNFEVVKNKPTAHIYVDDRAVCFRGDWDETIKDIGNFKQWQSDNKLRSKIINKRRRRSRNG